MTTVRQTAKVSDHEELTEGHKILTSKVLRLVDRKFMAEKLNISESMIAHWVAGTKPIPSERMFQILQCGKFFCRDWRGIEDELDAMLWQMGE